MPFYGFNIEDAVILNRGSIERGLGRLSYFRSYTDKEVLYPGGQRDYFRVPAEDSEEYLGEEAYKIIGDDNFPEVGCFADRDSF
jgi:DNA-directed RNA polymerase subunit B'